MGIALPTPKKKTRKQGKIPKLRRSARNKTKGVYQKQRERTNENKAKARARHRSMHPNDKQAQ